MKLLIIDSHKGNRSTPQNLHWLNASKIQAHLVSVGHSVDLIWSYPDVNDVIHTGYDVIIFNHASRYSYISEEWIYQNPDAKLFYITNEYNLGEPLVLWSSVKKAGRRYDVIANHPAAASKVVKKYVNTWNILNLNALIVEKEPIELAHSFFSYERSGCIYYGSFRADRVNYFKKYFNKNITVSTHVKNRYKFENIGIKGNFIDRINWSGDGLGLYKTSLYIEDESTHKNYNFLANRFYEALNYNTFPLFDTDCKNTLELSEYNIPPFAVVDGPEQLDYITHHLPNNYTDYLLQWREKALQEKADVLDTITKLVTS